MKEVLCVLCCLGVFFLMIRRPPRSTQSRSSAASDVYKRQLKHIDMDLMKRNTSLVWTKFLVLIEKSFNRL